MLLLSPAPHGRRFVDVDDYLQLRLLNVGAACCMGTPDGSCTDESYAATFSGPLRAPLPLGSPFGRHGPLFLLCLFCLLRANSDIVSLHASPSQFGTKVGTFVYRRPLALALTLIVLLSSAAAADPTGLVADFLVAPDGERYRIDDFNSPLGSNRLVVYTPDFGPSTATVDAMVEVVVVDGVVEEVLPVGFTNTPIPRDGYVISASGTAATWVRLHLRPGLPVALLRDRLVADAVSATHVIHQSGPNVTRGTDQLVLFTPGRERTGTNPWGTEAVVRDGIIVSVGGNDNPIPPDGFVLPGTAPRDWLTENARVGAAVYVEDGQVTIAFDSRSVAASPGLPRPRGLACAKCPPGGMPIAFRRAPSTGRAWDLLAEAEALQTAGEHDSALRAARGRSALRSRPPSPLPSPPVGIRRLVPSGGGN